MEAAEGGAERLRQANDRESRGKQFDWPHRISRYRREFKDAMNDDFSTAQAIAVLFDIARAINQAGDSGYRVAQGQELLSELAGVLGLTLKPPEKPALDVEPLLEVLISIRDQLREAKQWQLADEIRNKLDEAGIALEDTPQGTIWKRKR